MTSFTILSYIGGVLKVKIGENKYEFLVERPLLERLRAMPPAASGHAIQLLKNLGQYLGPVKEKLKEKFKEKPKTQNWMNRAMDTTSASLPVSPPTS